MDQETKMILGAVGGVAILLVLFALQQKGGEKAVVQQTNFEKDSRIPLTIGGILCGAVIGFLSAHHFALWGGFALIGQPYSPARSSLVPGHIMFFSVVLGAIGYAIGNSKNSKK